MKDERKVPAIRFKGFSDAWEQRKLEQEVIFSKGSGYSKADLSAEGLPLILYGRLYTNYESEITNVDTFAAQKTGTVFSSGNEVIVPASGETAEDIARASAVKVKGCMLGGDLNILMPKSNIDSTFLAISISNGEVSKKLACMAQGKSVVHIHNSDIEQLEIPFPSLTEQVKIVGVFRHIDTLITLHQRKLDKLKNIKKALLEKMFPADGALTPRLRFKSFDDAWEQRKLGEISRFINGRAYSQNELLLKGKYKVLRVGNFYTNDAWYYSDLDLDEKYYACKGDLLYTWSATFGPHIWFGDKVIFHYHIWKIELSSKLEKNFAVQLLDKDKDSIISDKNGSTMVHITKKGMEGKVVVIPHSTAEQQKIGSVLSGIDTLITLHQRKLDKLKNMKKALLDKMLV